ncbi:MAG: tetratricopeptide repeat protein [Armatimonadetes bacterium]|nr:tetratricopeptide repeat protein [Armatimonadota bacterium]MDE2206207.1 tetratricopeptide repeat protein [Armatimonadota bacterium]
METEEFIRSIWDYSDPAGSEARFRSAIAAELGGSAVGAELRTQVARSLGLQARYAEAHKLLDEIEAQLNGEPGPAMVRVHLERGRVLNSSGDRDAAIGFFSMAKGGAQAFHLLALEIDALHMLAIADPSRALVLNLDALELCDDAPPGPARQWRASLCNNIGWTLFDRGDAAGALDYFRRAVDARKEMNDEAGCRIAEWCVARAQRELGSVEEALAAQRSLLVRQEEAGNDAPFVWEELGECLLALNRPDEAKPWLERAYQMLATAPWRGQVTEERLERLKTLSG